MRFLATMLALLVVTAVSSSSYADPLEDRLSAGAQAFQAKDYERALVEFEQALTISDIPVVRFNIARANEALGKCELARTQYEALRDSESFDADIYEAAAARMKALPCARPPEPQPPPQPTQPATTAPKERRKITTLAANETVPPPPEPRSNTLAIIGWTTLGVGAAGFTAMLVEHLANRARINDGYELIAEPHGCSYSRDSDSFVGPSCDSAAAESDPRSDAFEADVRTARTRSQIILPITGGVMALGTAIILYSALRGERQVALVPWGGDGVAGVTTTIRF